MGLTSRLLVLFGICGICTGFLLENCTRSSGGKVLSVPGEAAMLNSSLVSPKLFDFLTVPYNITWYRSHTGQEIHNRSGRVVVRGETLWLLDTRLDHTGEYVSVLRTPSGCYSESTQLRVEPPRPGECGRPQKRDLVVSNGLNDKLSCPLSKYVTKLDSYSVSSSLTWFRGCEPLVVGGGRYDYLTKTQLVINNVDSENNHTYTCTLTFTLDGVTATVSESLNVRVRAERFMSPHLNAPSNSTIKKPIGTNHSQPCIAFVPGSGWHQTVATWWIGYKLMLSTNPSDRIHIKVLPDRRQNGSKEGVWLERVLVINELKEEDFNVNFTCQVQNPSGRSVAYFTLVPPDPNFLIPIGLVFCFVTCLLAVAMAIYHRFKVDMVLWLRGSFPVFYKNKDLDGRLYDAYVACPQPRGPGFSDDTETFALHTLPQVLEKACGYKLFIAGRDCLPGTAVVDSVEENIQSSRCLLLLYRASTFSGKKHTNSSSSSSSNNNNLSHNNNSEGELGDGKSGDGEGDGVCVDGRQQLEVLLAMHKTLLEGSLKVVLVELEEITPAQLALFPESVRHLRKKQGALCWWKEQRRWQQQPRRRRRREEDEEEGGRDSKQAASSPSPTSRFWKEMRYHMPVRGKRAARPEEVTLLNLR